MAGREGQQGLQDRQPGAPHTEKADGVRKGAEALFHGGCMKAVSGTAVTGRRWNTGMTIERAANGRRYRKRLRNWYHVDSHMKDMDNFAWGYIGTGPVCTSYSILRELFGKELALARYREFLERFVATLPEEGELHITGDEICAILGIGRGKGG